MKRFISKLSVLALLALPLVALPVNAQGKGNGQGRGNGNGNARQTVRGVFRDTDNRGPDNRPPGWDKGKKTGWGDCDVPPGQAKKTGCRTVTNRRHRFPVTGTRTNRVRTDRDREREDRERAEARDRNRIVDPNRPLVTGRGVNSRRNPR